MQPFVVGNIGQERSAKNRGSVTFKSDFESSGVSLLPHAIDINGIKLGPSFRYEGQNATLTSWTATVGSTLSLGGGPFGTGVTSVDNFTPFTDSTRAPTFSGVVNEKYFVDTSTDFQLGTDDFFVETVVHYATSGGKRYFGVADGGQGWFFDNHQGVRFSIIDSVGATTYSLFSSDTYAGWNHVVAIGDRDEASTNGMSIYVNGVRKGNFDISAKGSVGGTTLGVGGAGSGAIYDSFVAYAAGYKRASWFAGGAQNPVDWDEVVAERFNRLCGVLPQFAKGTPKPTYTRATAAITETVGDDGHTYLHRVGNHWPRLAQRKDASNATVTGYLAEAARTNLITYSEDFSNAEWTKTNSTITADQATTPFQDSRADLLAATSATTPQIHNPTSVAASTNYVFSYFVKYVAGTGIVIDLAGGTIGFSTAPVDSVAWYNINSGTSGTAGSLVNASGVIDFGGGWYRIWSNHTSKSNASTAIPGLRLADADASTNGDSAGQVYVFGFQAEAVSSTTEGPSSYIPTVASIATRNVDILTYNGDDGNIPLQGTKAGTATLFASALVPYTSSANQKLVSVGGGTSAARIYALSANTTGNALFEALNDGNDVSVVGKSMADGYTHDLSVFLDDEYLFVEGMNDDSSAGSGNLKIELPEIKLSNASATIRIGSTQAGGEYASSALIKRVMIRETNAVGTSFSASLSASGASYLDSDITLNGITVTPTFRYEAKGISGTTWTAVAGDNLTEAGTGTAPTTNRYTPFTDTTRAIRNESGKSYRAAAAAAGDVGTEDVVIEAVVEARGSTGASGYIVGKWSGSIGSKGYGLILNSSNTLVLLVDSAAGAESPNVSAALVEGWNHVLFIWDRSGGFRTYINGVHNSAHSTAISDHDGYSLATSSLLTITARSDLTNQCEHPLAYVSMWKAAAWLDYVNQADTDAVAAERFNKLCGVYPQFAAGTVTPSYTRATSAITEIIAEDGYTYLHQVASGWPRIAERRDGAGDIVTGFFVEASRTNLLLQSDNLSSGWTLENVTISTDSATTPFQDSRADGIIGSAIETTHRVYQGVSLVLNTHYCHSGYVKAGARSWCAVAHSSAAGTSSIYFDLSTGSVGSKTATNYGLVDCGNGWYRYWVNITASSTGTGYFVLYTAEANEDITYTGDGSTPDLYAFGFQVEAVGSATEGPSSYIPTVASTGTRNSDSLKYSGINNMSNSGAGSLLISQMSNIGSIDFDKNVVYMRDGDGTDYISITLDSSPQRPRVVGSGGLSIDAAGTAVLDGYSHDIRLTWTTNDARLYMDGSPASGTSTDSTYAPPTEMDSLYIGSSSTNSAHTNGLIHTVKLYNKIV